MWLLLASETCSEFITDKQSYPSAKSLFYLAIISWRCQFLMWYKAEWWSDKRIWFGSHVEGINYSIIRATIPYLPWRDWVKSSEVSFTLCGLRVEFDSSSVGRFIVTVLNDRIIDEWRIGKDLQERDCGIIQKLIPEFWRRKRGKSYKPLIKITVGPVGIRTGYIWDRDPINKKSEF